MTSRRALVALLLLLAIPLRALAAVAMPCCPPTMVAMADDDGSMASLHTMQHATPDAMQHAAPDDHESDRSLPADGGDHGHHGAASACSAAAMMAPPAALQIARAAPARSHGEPRAAPVAAFLTDAPDRPPRRTLSAA